MKAANLVEIFPSFQGEGPYAGEGHLFVRFQGCELSCQWCDTPATFQINRFCKVIPDFFSEMKLEIPNPVSVDTLQKVISDFPKIPIALTGGEPLQRSKFLKEWLSNLSGRTILLETAGVHMAALKEVLPFVSIISMDLKLPSSTGMRPYWKEHEEFLKMALSRKVYVKVVVTAETRDEEIAQAINLVAKLAPQVPFILQPVSETSTFDGVPILRQLYQWWQLANDLLPNVRVLPQMHKTLGMP